MEEFYQLRNIGVHSTLVYLLYVYINNYHMLDDSPLAPKPPLSVVLVTIMMIVASNSTAIFSMLIGVLFVVSVAAGIRKAKVNSSTFVDLGWMMTGMLYLTLLINAGLDVLNNLQS